MFYDFKYGKEATADEHPAEGDRELSIGAVFARTR
jgi:hypothetical protein